MSALPPKADIANLARQVRFVPYAVQQKASAISYYRSITELQ
jgi:hypothetical protein